MNPDQNPYRPPGVADEGFVPRGASDYAPLQVRRVLASIFIVATVGFGLLVDVSELMGGDKAQPDLAMALVAGVAGLGLLGSLIGAVITYCLWLHRAASNLRALGRNGMQFTPGGCVGSFFIPFINLIRPLAAVTEIWQASDPESQPDDWLASSKPSTLGLWWGTWIVASIISNVGVRLESPSAQGGVGLVSEVFMAIAAITCISLMRGIGERQDRLAQRVGA